LAADQCPDVVSIVGLVGNDDCALLEAGEPRFAALDAKYVSNCRNPLVKSAIPKGKQP
jgi:hypothetical protein